MRLGFARAILAQLQNVRYYVVDLNRSDEVCEEELFDQNRIQCAQSVHLQKNLGRPIGALLGQRAVELMLQLLLLLREHFQVDVLNAAQFDPLIVVGFHVICEWNSLAREGEYGRRKANYMGRTEQ